MLFSLTGDAASSMMAAGGSAVNGAGRGGTQGPNSCTDLRPESGLNS
jgi:hypothetical protein